MSGDLDRTTPHVAWDEGDVDDGAAEALASLDAPVGAPEEAAPEAPAPDGTESLGRHLDEPTRVLDRGGSSAADTSALPSEPATTLLPERDAQRGDTRPRAVQATQAGSTRPQTPPTVRRRPAASGTTTAGTPPTATAPRGRAQARRGGTQSMPPTAATTASATTLHRAPRRAHAVPSRPYGDTATRRAPQRAARRGSGGFGRRALAGVLRLVALVTRLMAIATCAIVVAGALPHVSDRLLVIDATHFVSRLVPQSLSGLFVITSPFGGSFRGDLALFAVALFVIDWALVRISAYMER